MLFTLGGLCYIPLLVLSVALKYFKHRSMLSRQEVSLTSFKPFSFISTVIVTRYVLADRGLILVSARNCLAQKV
jgi:hypothetical protein